MESKRIRQKYVDFFVAKGHTHVPSSSLIPAQDPTILFTNAGMNQFKDVFLGKETRPYKRAVTIQKCARAGGKHNDLENVGFTKRHLVFFEMLGNFSFGDYFKKEAIAFAWEFVTKEMGLPKEHLYVSIYKDDDESYEIWNKQEGVPSDKIYRLGEKENFWAMGDLGPCGPCTEIHIDRGPAWGCKNIEDCGPACDCDRFLEIWNNVFMQYDRQKDGSLKPLTKTGVDTGMGLERLCTVMQDKDSVYDTDLFTPIRHKTEELTGLKYDKQPDMLKAAFNVVAEHARSSSMLIADGCVPSNEGRGYVLRKIIRRAALFARKLTDKSLLPELSQVIVDEFGDVYTELEQHKELIALTLRQEVEKFSENLVRGQALLATYMQANNDSKIIPGEQAFKLYDTFGFPIELVTLIAKEKDYAVDMLGFEQEMNKQQERSGKPVHEALDYLRLPEHIHCEFTGYDELSTSTKVVALVDEHIQQVNSIKAGSSCWVITEKSPLFAMGGGQSPDRGSLTFGKDLVETQDVRLISGLVATLIHAPVTIKICDSVTVMVDEEYRKAIMRNHTATHLLQAALMELIDKNIKQSGSFVSDDYLRFDFTGNTPISHEQLNKIEQLVNKKIRENKQLAVEYVSFDQAKKRGALAFFEEKYVPEKVRVVTIPDFSAELCCGTHVHATGDIGSFKITELKTIAAGNRRIVAYTGKGAITLFENLFDSIKDLSTECQVPQEKLLETVRGYKKQIKDLGTVIKVLKKEIRASKVPQWLTEVEVIHEVPFSFIHVDNYTNDELKEIAAELTSKKPGFYFLISSNGDRVIFVAQVAQHFADRLNLKKFGLWLKERHGINGGGSQTLIQGGSDKFDSNLKDSIKDWLATI
jgi:alanyl-tRNA synthetase